FNVTVFIISLDKSNGKTALLKALLNLKEGENDTIEHLLEIAEKTGDLKDFVNAAYTDSYYKGQTALHVAIEQRIAKFVQMLVKKGADVHAKACGKFFQPNQETCFYFGELPLSLAACTNQPDIVDFLMNNPYQAVDVRERDSHGNTVLHALVSIADNSPENTEFVIAMYDHILFKADQLHPKIKLEEIENNEGLTPLTLAAKTGKVGVNLNFSGHIVQREFKGCKHLSRKITEWAYGPVCSSLYDLASLDTYEKNSALEIIVYGSEIPNRLEMLHIEPFNRLIEEKWERFAKRMFLFNFIVYVIYLFILTAVAYHREEGKDLKKKQVGIQAVGYIAKKAHQNPPNPSKTHPKLYLAVLFLACALLYCFGQDEYVACLVLCLALSWVNLLYFSRGSKNMGIYNVMIQKMVLGEIRRFLVVYMVFLIGFSAAVVTLLDERVPSMGRSLFAPITGNENCTKPSFKSIYYTTLEMFKFTIGMGNLEFTNQYKYIEVFYVLLILYIVMTYILMLNMLIALMNQRSLQFRLFTSCVYDTLSHSLIIARWFLEKFVDSLSCTWSSSLGSLQVYLHTFMYVLDSFTFTFSDLADVFIQSDLQMRTMEAIKINKRAMICKCYMTSLT
uniref:Transient receptor potential cation channel subfamily V member 1-like n=1 Tax=Sinocyclocheilus rhinocerous TaxID=307959 RepID=A0A673LPD9_9TELE